MSTVRKASAFVLAITVVLLLPAESRGQQAVPPTPDESAELQKKLSNPIPTSSAWGRTSRSRKTP